jgi:hypothetical protein
VTEEASPTVRVSRRFWPTGVNPAADGVEVLRLARACTERFLSTLPPPGRDPYLRFTITQDGPPRKEHTYTDLGAWLDAGERLTGVTAAQLYVAVGSEVSLSVHCAAGEETWADVAVDYREGTLSDAALEDLWTPFVGWVHSNPRTEPAAGGRPDAKVKSTARRRFQNVRLATPDPVAAAVTSLQVSRYGTAGFNGDLRVDGQDRAFATVEPWVEALAGTWDDVERLWFSFWGPDSSHWVAYDRPHASLVVEARADSGTEAERLVADLLAGLDLPADAVAGERAPALTGEQRLYHLTAEATPEWFAATAAHLARAAGTTQWFEGRLGLVGDGHDEQTFDDETDWARAVERQWSGLATFTLTRSSAVTRLRARCDLERELLELDVRAVGSARADALFDELAGQVGLERASRPVYAVRSTADLGLRSWRNAELAENVGAAVTGHVGGRAALVQGSSRIVDADGSVGTFPSVAAFLERASDADPYTELHLVVEGPRGATLGVHLEPGDDGDRLHVSSSATGAELSRICATLTRRLVVADEAPGPAPEPAAAPAGGRAKGGRRLARLAIPLLTFAAGFALSPAFFGAAFADDTLTITLPAPSTGTTVAEVASGQVTVEWVVTTERWFRTGRDRDAPADIRLLANDQGVVATYENQRPGAVLPVTPGTYDLEVVDVESQASGLVRVVVPAPTE